MSNLAGGGAQRRTLTLAHEFARCGHQVDLVVITADGPLREHVHSPVRLVLLETGMHQLPLVRHVPRFRVGASVSALARYLRRERPDVLLSAASHVNLAAVWAHRLSGTDTRLVLRASNHISRAAFNTKRLPRPFLQVFARLFYPWADAVVAVSTDVAQDLLKITGMPREQVTVIHNPVVTPELDQRARESIDHPWFREGEPPVVLGAGRLASQKDFPTLVRAFARLRSNRPARLMILGEGKGRRRSKLAALAEQLGVADDVALPGFVDNPYPFMAHSAAFVLSSAWEGLPGALIEAMACGCPVISTDCPGGSREILAGGEYGPLVPVGDAVALAKAIEGVMDSPPDSASLRARAEQFSIDGAVKQYLDVLLSNPLVSSSMHNAVSSKVGN